MSLQPTLPGGMLRAHTELRASPPIYQADNGGQYLPGAVTEIEFYAAILPLSEADLRRAPQGAYTQESRKLYANGYRLEAGTSVRDPCGDIYVVIGTLDYGYVSPVKRYIVERKGAAGNPA